MTDIQTEPLLYHKPVLVEEVLTYLALGPGKVYLDVTFGTGGHTKAILEREPKCHVIAMDWDLVALDTYGLPLQAHRQAGSASIRKAPGGLSAAMANG